MSLALSGALGGMGRQATQVADTRIADKLDEIRQRRLSNLRRGDAEYAQGLKDMSREKQNEAKSTWTEIPGADGFMQNGAGQTLDIRDKPSGRAGNPKTFTETQYDDMGNPTGEKTYILDPETGTKREVIEAGSATNQESFMSAGNEQQAGDDIKSKAAEATKTPEGTVQFVLDNGGTMEDAMEIVKQRFGNDVSIDTQKVKHTATNQKVSNSTEPEPEPEPKEKETGKKEAPLHEKLLNIWSPDTLYSSDKIKQRTMEGKRKFFRTGGLEGMGPEQKRRWLMDAIQQKMLRGKDLKKARAMLANLKSKK